MIIPVNLGENSYDIVLKRGALKELSSYINRPEGTKVLVVTDSGVPPIYAETVAKSFDKGFIYTFLQGEKSKNFDTYRSICEKMLELSFTRKDAVVAVGGGVCGDMAGFAAATYMRGIDFYNIPTTVLSQVDSSIGGKTAVDLGRIKNIIGAFHQPKKVIIDLDVLDTLDERQIRNGFAESIKMGMTGDSELFEIFLEKDFKNKIEEIIERSLRVKKLVVETDEKETGLRKVLNFGHTIGHAIEAATEDFGLLHGECVALGMTYMCEGEVREKLLTALRNAGLPTFFDTDKEKIFAALTHDKKSEGESITVVKCPEIGSYEFQKLTPSELLNLI